MLQLKVEAIKWETPDTATFFLSELSGSKVHYQAGQFITFIFTHHNEDIRRSYSLSSSPDEELLSVTIKRIANGEISRFLLMRVRPGDILNALEPAGRFTINDFDTEKDIFFFAAGSGITPVFSQLKYILQRPGKSNITLVYSSQDEAILFGDTLNELSLKHPDRLAIIYFLSSQAKRLNNILVEELVLKNIRFDITKADFYLCGPFTYMRMVRLTLVFMGIKPYQVRKENFVPDNKPVADIFTNYPPRKVVINFKDEKYELAVGQNQTILQAALQNNIQLPYSCRDGICSACSALCKSGNVEMSKNEVLTDADLAQGWILTCTGHAVTDNVVIEYPA